MWIGIAGVAGFVIGLVFHRYILSEAKTIENALLTEIHNLRADLGVAVGSVGKKIGG